MGWLYLEQREEINGGVDRGVRKKTEMKENDVGDVLIREEELGL